MGFLDFIDPGNSGGSVPTPSSPWDRLPPPAPVVYRCVVCNAAFPDPDRLFEHRFTAHPYKRPALILGGRELTSPREVVVRPLTAADIVLANTDLCFFDGASVKPEHLAALLSNQRDGLHTVVLNKLGIETSYEIAFEIAAPIELDEVDRLFLSIVGAETLTVDRINLFVDIAEPYPTAKRYLDGLCQYLYGVLAKDQRGGTHLQQSDYKTRFNLALDTLRLFDRPLANVAVGVVNFSQNAFNDGESLDASVKLQYAMRVFSGFLRQIVVEKPSSWPVTGVGNVPIDHATDQIVSWASEGIVEMLKHRREMESVISSPVWVPDDRFKVSILLAERLAKNGNIADAQIHARLLVNDGLFGEWAQQIIEMDAKK